MPMPVRSRLRVQKRKKEIFDLDLPFFYFVTRWYSEISIQEPYCRNWDDFKSLIGKLERDREYRFYLLITIGVFTGLRISDLLQHRFSQIENTEILTVQEKKTKLRVNDYPPRDITVEIAEECYTING
jgi:integrase